MINPCADVGRGLVCCTAFCSGLLNVLSPKSKTVRDKKAEDRFAALLGESPKSSPQYDIMPDGIYHRDKDTVSTVLV